MKTLVFNGWAAGPDIWALCDFERDYLFSYLESLEGLPRRVLAESEAALLVGFSMGGTFALKMLLEFPEKIRGLVLISSTPRMMEEPSAGWLGMSPRRRRALKLGTQLVYRNDPSPIYREDNLERGLKFLDETDLRAELLARKDEFDFPVYVFQSERDGIVRPTNAVFFKELFPSAEVTMIPGGEHVLPITAYSAISAAVKAAASRTSSAQGRLR